MQAEENERCTKKDRENDAREEEEPMKKLLWLALLLAATSALAQETAPETLFIIQPVTPYGGCKAASPEKILICQNYALTKLKDVRVIPQTHKMIGQI